jgi:hypothetical protein
MAMLMLLNTACYSYIPVATGVVPAAGDFVRVRLTEAGMSAQANSLGPRVEWAQGMLSERRPDGSIVVGVTQVRLLDGIDRFWAGQGIVTLAPEHVAEVQRRAVDKGKTRTAGIVLAAGLVGVALMALGTGGAGGGTDAGGTPPPP